MFFVGYNKGMSEPDLILNATIDGKAVEIAIKPNDLDELYSNFLEYRRAYECVHSDEVVREAAEIAIEVGKVSTNLLQRRLRIGYGRAASILDELEELGVIGPEMHGNKPREVLMSDIKEYDSAKKAKE